MLFDLRSRGRRTTVKVVYSMLAVLMGAGLVLFGIGGATSGGFLNGLTGGGGGGGSVNTPEKAEKHLETIVRRDPTSQAAWLRLAQIRLNIANANAQTGGQLTANDLEQVSQAWKRYVALSPEHPDNTMAQQMIAVYGPSPGLNQPANLVGAVEAHLAATKKPTATDYETYAVAATLANQARKAGLATDKAKALAAAGKKGQARKKAITQVDAEIAALQQQLGGGGSTVPQTASG
jgi:hypothetical protein